MTNYERSKEMNKEELSKFLYHLCNEDLTKTKIFDWLDRVYCSKCPYIEVILKDKSEMWRECNFEGKCPHQNWDISVIKLWLDSEIK